MQLLPMFILVAIMMLSRGAVTIMMAQRTVAVAPLMERSSCGQPCTPLRQARRLQLLLLQLPRRIIEPVAAQPPWLGITVMLHLVAQIASELHCRLHRHRGPRRLLGRHHSLSLLLRWRAVVAQVHQDRERAERPPLQ